MAKKSVIYRNINREKMVIKYRQLREKLKQIIRDPKISEEEKWDAQMKLQKLPRDSSPVRVRRRCADTGRPRGCYRRFRLSRIKLREYARQGDLPGLVKASW